MFISKTNRKGTAEHKIRKMVCTWANDVRGLLPLGENDLLRQPLYQLFPFEKSATNIEKKDRSYM